MVIYCAAFIRLAAENNLIDNIIGLFQATGGRPVWAHTDVFAADDVMSAAVRLADAQN